MTNHDRVSENPKSALIKGAFWMVGTRWLIKVFGFLNTVIVARMVAPQDYGVIAMAFLVVSLTQATRLSHRNFTCLSMTSML
ncbi:MAG: hypothetical protein ACOYNF_03930, partial [Rhodoferax sp.]